MTKTVEPTKEKQVIHGNTVYLNDEGHMVVEHLSGNVIVTDTAGKITTTRPDGGVTVLNPDGTSETRDKDGNLIHYADKSQSYKVSKDGDVEF